MQNTGIVADEIVKLHDTGPGSPEQPERYSVIVNQLSVSGILDEVSWLTPRPASEDELALVHSRDYISLVGAEIAAGRRELSTGDTMISAQSLRAALIAAGAVIEAVDSVFEGSVMNAFCIVRPPGHHASRSRGMGFCLFNNVAVGARYAQQTFGAKRILIADWDVHHGNGTQDIFYDDGSVLFFSTHQSPWYPGTGAESERGEGEGLGTTINVPLPAGSGHREIFAAFEDTLAPAAERFEPDLILLSAGFDSREGDPLGKFLLTDRDFADLTALMMELASQFCDGRLVSVLEGGYNLTGLAQASQAHVRALLG